MVWQNFILNFPAGRRNMPIKSQKLSLRAYPAALGLAQLAMFLQPCWLGLFNISLTEVLCHLERNRRDVSCTPKLYASCTAGVGNEMTHKPWATFSSLLFYSHTKDRYCSQINTCAKPVTFTFFISGAQFHKPYLDYTVVVLLNEQKPHWVKRVYIHQGALKDKQTNNKTLRKQSKETRGGNQDRWGMTKIIYTRKNKEYFSSLALWIVLTGLSDSLWKITTPKAEKKVMGNKV